MSFFSKLFGGSSGRKEAAANLALAQQQEAAAANQREFLAQLAAAAADRDAQLKILTEQGNASLAAAAETARLAQTQAEEASYRASLTPADSEDARAAADRRQKKLQQKRGFASTVVSRSGDGLGAAPVATAQLLGA